MVLTGTYQRTLDDKLRFPLPRGLRQQLSDSEPPVLFLAPGMDGSLVLYPEQAFELLAQRIAASSGTGKAAGSGTGKAVSSGTGKAVSSGTGKAVSSGTGKAVRAFSRLFYG